MEFSGRGLIMRQPSLTLKPAHKVLGMFKVSITLFQTKSIAKSAKNYFYTTCSEFIVSDHTTTRFLDKKNGSVLEPSFIGEIVFSNFVFRFQPKKQDNTNIGQTFVNMFALLWLVFQLRRANHEQFYNI
jgi:hypothetical protein